MHFRTHEDRRTLGLEAFVAIAEQGASSGPPTRSTSRRPRSRAGCRTSRRCSDVKLVERTTRSVALTRIGARFLPQCPPPAHRPGERAGRDPEDRQSAARRRRDRVRPDGRRAVPAAHHPRVLRALSRRTASRFSTTRRRAWPRRCSGARPSSASTSADRTTRISRASRCCEDRFVLICRDDHPFAAAAGACDGEQLAP